MIPTLTTGRLTLRGPVAQDFAPYAELFASDRSTYMGGPRNRDQAWHEFAADIVGWQLFGFGYWTIADSASKDVLGFLGFAAPPCYPELELGWMVTTGAEGKGIAFEAATAARNFGFDTLGRDSFVSYIDPPNLRSRALAERLGATLDPDAAAPSRGDLVFRHHKPGGQP